MSNGGGIKNGSINTKGPSIWGIGVPTVIIAVFFLALAALHFAPNAFPMPMEAMMPDTESAPAESALTAAEHAAKAAEHAAKAAAIVSTPTAAAQPDASAAINETAAAPGETGAAPRQRRNLVTEKTLQLYLGESDWNFIGVMTLRFVMNILFAYVLISLIYSREHRIREYSFSFFVSNILIFMVTSLLASVRVRTGFAFGLFAILSILRYRTEQIQIREMTFLFASIILGVINSLATADLTIFAVLWANVMLCMFVYICDSVFMGHTDQILLVYDNTKLLSKDKKQELHEDIKNRFGYDVVKVVIIKMSYLTDSAEVKLVYKRK